MIIKAIYKKGRGGTTPGPALPGVSYVRSLEPLAYFDFRHRVVPQVGQNLHLDEAAMHGVRWEGDTVGAAKNLGTAGGYAAIGGTNRPTWGGFEEGALFDGLDDYLEWTELAAPVAQPYTIVVGLSPAPASLGVNRMVNDSTSSEDRALIQWDESRTTWMCFAGDALDAGDEGVSGGTSTRSIAAVYDGAESFIEARDGDGSNITSASGDAGSNALQNIRLGCRFNFTNFFSGHLRAWALFPHVLTPEEMIKVQETFK